MQPDQVLDFDWLFQKLCRYVFDEETPPFNLFGALAGREDVAIDMSEWEWSFLQTNLDFVRRVVNNPLPAAMIYTTNRSPSGAFYTRDFARMTGESEQKVNLWANRLAAKSVLTKHTSTWDRRVYYVSSKKMPTINRILLNLALSKFTPVDLDRYMQRTQKKRLVNQARMARLREYRKRHYRRHRNAGLRARAHSGSM